MVQFLESRIGEEHLVERGHVDQGRGPVLGHLFADVIGIPGIGDQYLRPAQVDAVLVEEEPGDVEEGKPEMATPLPSSQLSQIWTMRRSATALRWVSMAPLGLPVVPPVYWMYAMSSGVTVTAGGSAENDPPLMTLIMSTTNLPGSGVTSPGVSFSEAGPGPF